MIRFESFLSQGIHIGNHMITVGDILLMVTIFVLTRLFVLVLNSILKRVFKQHSLEAGKGYTLLKLTSYFLYTVGVIIGLELVGVDITIFVTVFAALLVGIGFGIQHIFNDIVSGFLILFEGTVRVGDIIELGGEVSKVKKIDIRTTKVENRSGNYIIIPNSEITSKHLTNWSYNDLTARQDIRIGVAYGSNTQLVKKLLLEVAENNSHIKQDMPKQVLFLDFGENALIFELRIWITRNWEMDNILSDIRFDIDRSFAEGGIKIPFPQREIHLAKPNTNPLS